MESDSPARGLSLWNERAKEGPDAEVDGWLYQLGVTGIRVRLNDDVPTHLIVGHVFQDSPADGRVEVGDHVVGAGSARFETPHRNGYGMEVFGPTGPIEEFAEALEAALGERSKPVLSLSLLRGEDEVDVKLNLRKARGKYPTFAPTFPYECKRTAALREALLETLVEAQREDGSFGTPVHDTFAPLALLASGSPKHRRAVEKNVRYHARRTSRIDDASLVNWRYMTAAIVMSEWYLATKDRSVLPELQEVHDFLVSSQYVSLDQVTDLVKESHPHAHLNDARQQYGGWDHDPGFEGYGPIAMLTGQGALAFVLMRKCGIEVDEDRHRELALRHATLIGEKPLSFPDTHASPLMGMGYAAAAALVHEPSFKALMQANRWWFLLADCGDGTFHYQPNRDNTGYGSDARIAATAVTAFILWLPERGLALAR